MGRGCGALVDGGELESLANAESLGSGLGVFHLVGDSGGNYISSLGDDRAGPMYRHDAQCFDLAKSQYSLGIARV